MASSTKSTGSQSASNGGYQTKDAIRAAAGVAALGFAGRTIIKNARRPRVLGIPVPRELSKFDTQKLAKQLSKIAEQVERTSEDVRLASAQTKRVADKFG